MFLIIFFFSGGAQKRKLDENDDEVLKKLRLEPEVFSGTIESKQTPPFKVTGRLLFGELTQKLPERIVLQGRMKLDELLTYFEKLKRASTSRKITAIYVDCDRNENFTKTFDHLYDSFKGAVIDKKDCAEGYVIPVKNQDLPKFFDAGVTLPASHIQHLLIVVVSQKVVPKPDAAKEQPKQEEAKSAEEKKEEPAKEAEKKE